MPTQAASIKQPPVFKLSVFTSASERFGYYILAFLFVLYATNIFDLPDAKSFMLFGIFSSLSYVTPAIGGYLADRIFGIRRCMIIGLCLESIGLFFTVLSTFSLFAIGLSLIILGVGFYKTTPTHLLGRSYEKGDPRIDSGFTWYYMAMNVGGLLCSFAAGLLQRYFGFQIAFLFAGISLLFALLFYFIFRQTAVPEEVTAGKKSVPFYYWIFLVLSLVISTFVISFLVLHVIVANIAFGVIALLTLVYFLYEIIRTHEEEKRRIIVAIILILFGLAFYIFYFQLFTSIVLFMQRSMSRQLFGYTIPTPVFLSLNPIWILILSPILAPLYHRLGRMNKDLAVTTKFICGLFFVTLAFFILPISIHFANADGKVSASWIIAVYGLASLAELLIAALGVAMITHIAPKRLYGVMMGAWYLLAMAAAAILSGLCAGLANVPKTVHDPFVIAHIYSSAFLKLGIGGLVIAVVALALNPFLKRFASLN